MRSFLIWCWGGIYLASIFLVPPTLFYRPEYFMALFTAALAATVVQSRVIGAFKVEAALIIFLGIFGAIAVFQQSLAGKPFVAADAMIILRYGYYVAALIMGGVIAEKVRLGSVRSYVLPMLVACLALSILQYKNVFGLNKIVVPLYTVKGDLLIHGDYWRRVVGTYGNPNYWGLLLGFGFLFAVPGFLWGRRLWVVILFPAVAYCLLLTGSRAAMVATAVAMSVGAAIVSGAARRSPRALPMLIIFVGFIALVGMKLSLLSSVGYENPDRFTNVESFYTRVKYWEGILDNIMRSNGFQVLFGRGPMKEVAKPYGDNILILLLRDYGAISVVLYLALFTRMYFRSIQQLRHHETGPFNQDIAALSMVTLAYGIFDLSADAWFNVRVAGLFLFFYGFIVVNAMGVSANGRTAVPDYQPQANAPRYANLCSNT
ncbi:MAG: hypothetical protein HY749_18035 [Gammaproteobacteria bacterium]|nr:hypothetical protein [Gammaproteobacteria bacterium]